MSMTYQFALEPNKTNSWRRATWEVYTKHPDLLSAVLQVDERRHPTSKKVTTRRYAVQEIPHDKKKDGIGRKFRLSHPMGSGKEPYVVFLSVFPRDCRCVCKRHDKAGECVHIQALRALYFAPNPGRAVKAPVLPRGGVIRRGVGDSTGEPG
jgi:hypothetical protein